MAQTDPPKPSQPKWDTPPLLPQPGEIRTAGVLERILFYDEQSKYCVGELREEKGRSTVTIVGTLPEVQCGETLSLAGQWTQHPRHGQRFKVRAFQSTLPACVYGIRKYLGSGLVRGIGKQYADRIVDHFGGDTFNVIAQDSGRLLEVPGIGKKRAKHIKQSWEEQEAVREVMIFLQAYGISSAQCLRLVQRYGQHARQLIQQHPYRLAREINGIGFKTADKIAINMGLSNESTQRIDAGILYALEKLEGDGHTAYPADTLKDYSAQLLDIQTHKVAERLKVLSDAGSLRPAVQAGLVQLPKYFEAESGLAQSLKSTLEQPRQWPSIHTERAIAWAQERVGFAFAPEQSAALSACLKQKAIVITGGPGTGKTTILNALVAILQAKKICVRLASPTGRAAQRMTEATGVPTQTIHRLLKFDPQLGAFTHDEHTPLKCDCVIIDEVGMLDTLLASALLRALPPTAHLILVGDVHQLPSVGPGTILKTLIACGHFAVCRLKHIFRQNCESAIITAAYAILNGTSTPPCAIIDSLEDLQPECDLHFIRAVEPEVGIQRVIELYQHIIPQHYGIDPIMEVQTLVPMHRGSAGVETFNTMLQRVLNPRTQGLKAGRYTLYVGDKVIQTRNNYEKGIFNGDLGRIIAIDSQARILTIQFNEGAVAFAGNELNDLQLAYATSIHKAQGSEFPMVVLPLFKQYFVMLQRTLLYTAITRGRSKVFLIGDPSAYAMAVNNKKSQVRYSDLRAKLASCYSHVLCDKDTLN